MELDDVFDKITHARIKLVQTHPFFGNIATRMSLKENNTWCKTAATDGRNLYFNREFLSSLKREEVEFVIAHELLHVIYDHFSRLQSRNQKVFNIAADYAINWQLAQEKIGKKPSKIEIFLDKKYADKSAEEIYDILIKSSEDAIKQLAANGELVDQHVDWQQGAGQGSSNGDTDSDMPTYSESEMNAIRDEFREAVLASCQSVGIGNTPAGVRRMIDGMLEPKMSWRQILQQQIQSVVKSDYSFLRTSRKGWHMNAILPSQIPQETIDICVSIDMSGSISNEQAKEFLAEIKGIMQEFTDFTIRLWSFDTQVYNDQEFTSYNIHEFDDYTPTGGGGTSFAVNWDYMKENDIVPKKFIMFTDMYCHEFGDANYCDTIFIAHGEGYKSFIPPHGIVVPYE